jgi:hypothetical protein
LVDLLDQAKITGKKKITLKAVFGPVSIHGLNDGEVRFTSFGQINGKQVSHYAGCDESAINMPVELVAMGSKVEGVVVDIGTFYAQFDLHEDYGLRHLTVYFNPNEPQNLSQELRNQLTSMLPPALPTKL